MRALVLLAALALGGCASAYVQGRVALADGRWADAAAHFEGALAREPGAPEARLYLGLVSWRRGQDREAEAQLTALRRLDVHPRTTAALDRAGRVMGLAGLPDEVRAFVAASLENELAWERDVREARRPRPLPALLVSVSRARARGQRAV